MIPQTDHNRTIIVPPKHGFFFVNYVFNVFAKIPSKTDVFMGLFDRKETLIVPQKGVIIF